MSAVTRLTLLGTGSSGGVPRANGDWGDCDPANPKNRRRRCSALIERARSRAALSDGQAVTRVVIDTSPDFREQMLSAQVRRIDAVLLTHDHADQTHGIDDLRAFAYLQRQRIPVWMDVATRQTLTVRFGYTFAAPPGSGYPPILDQKVMPDFGDVLEIDGPGGCVSIAPFDQEHGRIRSVGFRIGQLAYSADINGLPDESASILDRVSCWVVDALRDEPHPTHFNVDDALAALARVKAASGVLTNLHITLDHAALSARLPEGVKAGFDGLRILASDDGTIEQIG
ncbi:MBL fold metallo-hydrolase [Maricaulis sp.]|uniref:MBL fold metallo-hydrolase n=1 Tax=Maricaulis sp. TaxID=1486257 RepID=UPI002B26C3C4|nr:MBL fold metallo-hydrolase [Maricaulis sp.]